MSLVSNIDSLTVKEVREVLEHTIEYVSDDYFYVPEGQDRSTFARISPSFSVPPWHGQWGKYFAAKDRNKYIIDTCQNLRKWAEDPEAHVSCINAHLSSLLECRVSVRGVQPGSFENEFAIRAYRILKRLPFRPLELIGAPDNLDERYFVHDKTPRQGNPAEPLRSRTWGSLRIAASLSSGIVQMALYIVISGSDTFGNMIADYPDILAELLEACSGLASHCTSSAEQHQWYIVRAALWSSWQRSLMLYHYANLRDALERGLTGSQRLRISLRSTTPIPGLSIHEMSSLHAAHEKARSMCSWAFELLRTEPVCLSIDFRTFHHRYSQLWGNTPARCQKGSPMPCAGNDPDGCWRFKGMLIKDQSAHDSGCEGRCPKIPWHESSYRSIIGARAVTLASGRSKANNLHMKYCSASGSTMAISHVWSHGQGGRPHVGVNRCLHWRYVKIAELLGCDSYWWDSACIPEDHKLRFEAIQKINSTFSSAKVILVCDKDLMRIDISELTMQIKESILATVFVCDWNLRAWTFLESVRGRHNIHLLCKDNKTISFREVVQDVFEFGSIDLAILSFTVPHMLPDRVEPPGFWTREEVGQVLSYRPASRKGDDIVIWSLLASEEAHELPEELWRNQPRGDSKVHTGFLMSSAPRLRKRGLSWAPSTPYFKPLPETSTVGVSSFRAFISNETWPGTITDKGLLATWHVYEFDTSNVSQSGMLKDSQTAILEGIRALYLQDSTWGALLLPMSNMSTFERDRETSTKYNGLVRGALVAVLGCNGLSRPSQKPAEERAWMWKGVFEWDSKIDLPAFKVESDFLIE